MHLRTLKIIGTELIDFLAEVEKLLDIKIDLAIIDKIRQDAEADAASVKSYVLFESTKNLCKSDFTITGKVEAYEPETIWIEIAGLSEKELEYLRH